MTSSIPERRPLPGWEGLYEVSSDGRVYSLDRVVRSGRNVVTRRERELRITPNSRGYAAVSLCHDGRKEFRRVHRLVALAFLPNPHGYTEVNHKDGNRMNARLENLEWCRPSDNRWHAYHVSKTFRMPNRGKLSYEIAEQIRRESANASIAELAQRYGVKDHAIRCVLKRKTYPEPPRQLNVKWHDPKRQPPAPTQPDQPEPAPCGLFL